MILQVELSQDELIKLIADALSKRLNKTVNKVLLRVNLVEDFRGDVCGNTVSAVASIAE